MAEDGTVTSRSRHFCGKIDRKLVGRPSLPLPHSLTLYNGHSVVLLSSSYFLLLTVYSNVLFLQQLLHFVHRESEERQQEKTFWTDFPEDLEEKVKSRLET